VGGVGIAAAGLLLGRPAAGVGPEATGVLAHARARRGRPPRAPVAQSRHAAASLFRICRRSGARHGCVGLHWQRTAVVAVGVMCRGAVAGVVSLLNRVVVGC
jgi:hypothetical protein